MWQEWNGKTEKFCVCGRAAAAQPRQPPALLFSKAQGKAGSRERGNEPCRTQTPLFPPGTGDRMIPAGHTHTHTHTPHCSPQAQDAQRGAGTAFPTTAAVPVGAASLKKDTYPCFLFS